MESAIHHVKSVFGQLDKRFQSTDGITGIASGIPLLDDTGGMYPGELIVLAGHPGAGKTALAISVALAASAQGTDVLYIALAESGDHIIERALLVETSVDNVALRRGMLTREDMVALTHRAADVAKCRIHVEDSIDATAGGIRLLVRKWRADRPDSRALVIVDYVQLLNPEAAQVNATRDAELSAALRTLQNAAKESSVSVLLVSQLNRRWAERSDPRPQLIDLRESGTLEAVATAVVFIHPPLESGHPHEVILEKHRRAATPRMNEFAFNGATGTFRRVPNPQ